MFSVINPEGAVSHILPGYYQVSKAKVFASDILGGAPLTYFTAAFSQQLLSNLGSGHPFVPTVPGPVPQDLLEMIYEILKCPFQEAILDFYYANKVREVLFSHVVATPMAAPGEMNAQQVAAMYEADRIMADNLDGRITIPELARRLGTNFVTLKRNYEKVFGIGIFPRLMQRKMDHIKLLLEKTDKPLKEIADLAGYQTLPGFINAFRKRFGMTPKEWRKQRRGY
jgi:AraC-like DNA-binding protein